jgi:hypothetical protein
MIYGDLTTMRLVESDVADLQSVYTPSGTFDSLSHGSQIPGAFSRLWNPGKGAIEQREPTSAKISGKAGSARRNPVLALLVFSNENSLGGEGRGYHGYP